MLLSYCSKSYAMSSFKLPTTLCHEIEILGQKFWWGQRGDRRKVHWLRWEELCNHKDQWGMGFKDLTMFNEAMLAKLSRWLLHDDNSLFFRVFKARFFPNGSILDAKESASASYAWRSILIGRDVILKGALWRWEMVNKLKFGATIGCQQNPSQRLLPQWYLGNKILQWRFW